MTSINEYVQIPKTEVVGKMVYVAKYALSKGIITGIVRNKGDQSNIIDLEEEPYVLYYLGDEAFLTEAEALAKAEQMRLAKIKSIKKTLAKYEAMRFTEL